jgi:hypothetical protein
MRAHMSHSMGTPAPDVSMQPAAAVMDRTLTAQAPAHTMARPAAAAAGAHHADAGA